MKRISKRLAKFDAFGCVWFRGPVCSYLQGKILIKIEVVEIQQPDRRLKQSSFRALSHPLIASGYGSMPMLGDTATLAPLTRLTGQSWSWLVGRLAAKAATGCTSHDICHQYTKKGKLDPCDICRWRFSWHSKNHWARMGNSNETRGFASALPWPMAVRQCPGRAWS